MRIITILRILNNLLAGKKDEKSGRLGETYLISRWLGRYRITAIFRRESCFMVRNESSCSMERSKKESLSGKNKKQPLSVVKNNSLGTIKNSPCLGISEKKV